MIKWLKYFYDSVNIVVIWTPRCKFFSAKCVQFSFTFCGIKLNEADVSFVTVAIHFWDKFYQEKSLKSYLMDVPRCK